MSIKILTKSGEEITAIDDARAYNFDAGNKSGIVKGALNEGKLFLVSSNVIGLDSCELRISGHRVVIDSAESITMANRPSVATRYSMIAEVVVSDASVPSFRLFIQPAKTELIQQNLYKTLNGNGTYQLRIGNFTLGTDGLISDIVRTADVISGATNGVGDIEFNVTTETIAGDLEPEVNVDFNEETKKYDMHFALPLSSGTSVIENGEVVKRFNADSKVDKVEGKGLSTNDFSDEAKNKLAGIDAGATKVIVDASLNESSQNPVQNNVVAKALNKNQLFLDTHPIGSYYITEENESPVDKYGGGWLKLDEGYTLWTASSGAGEKISAGLPNITDRIKTQGVDHKVNSILTSSTTGLFTNDGATEGIYTDSSTYTTAKGQKFIKFDASKGGTDTIYGKSTTVQPPAYKVYVWKRIS